MQLNNVFCAKGRNLHTPKLYIYRPGPVQKALTIMQAPAMVLAPSAGRPASAVRVYSSLASQGKRLIAPVGPGSIGGPLKGGLRFQRAQSLVVKEASVPGFLTYNYNFA